MKRKSIKNYDYISLIVLLSFANPVLAKEVTSISTYGNDAKISRFMSFEKIYARIARFVYVGSRRDDIERYLKWANIEYGSYSNSEGKYIQGIIRGIRGGFIFVDKSVELIIRFDKTDIATEVIIRPIYTSF